MVRTRDSEKAFILFVRIALDLAFSNTKSRVQDDSRLVAIPAPIPQPSTSEPIKGARNIVQTLKGCRRAVRRGVRSVCAWVWQGGRKVVLLRSPVPFRHPMHAAPHLR